MNFFGRQHQLPPLAELRVAVKTSNTVLLRKVLASHPDLLHYRDEESATPLHWAAKWQDLSLVAALVELGADVTAKDCLGYTARDTAYWFGEFRMGSYTDVCKKIVARLEAPPYNAGANA